MPPEDVSIARAMLADAPGLLAHPGLISALATGRASSFQVRAVDQFVASLELAKQVELARQSGAHLPLDAADKQLLDLLGQDYSDVDAGRLVTHPADPQGPTGGGGFWSAVGRGSVRARGSWSARTQWSTTRWSGGRCTGWTGPRT